MKPALLILLLVAAIAAGLLSPKRAEALGGGAIFKEVTLTVVVTPSPAPVVYGAPHALPGRPTAQANRAPSGFETYGAGWIAAPVQIAQAQPQGNIPVTLQTKADPNYNYLHVVSHTMVLNAPYGPSTYLCAYEIYASTTTTWHVTDWVYGSGPSGSNVFPGYNYPTASALAWFAQGASNYNTNGSAFVTFYNNGSPGQLVFQSAAEPGTNAPAAQTQQRCIDLQLTVPDSLPAGSYTTTIQYNLVAG